MIVNFATNIHSSEEFLFDTDTDSPIDESIELPLIFK